MKRITNLLAAGMLLATLASGFAEPVITNQPTWLTNGVGSTALFSVGATGAPPLSYQWRFNGVDRPGATNDTLVLTNVQTSNQGNYSVVVTEFGGLSIYLTSTSRPAAAAMNACALSFFNKYLKSADDHLLDNPVAVYPAIFNFQSK